MDLFLNHIETHPARYCVRRVGKAFKATLPTMDVVTGEILPNAFTEFYLRGITDTLKDIFWPNYKPVHVPRRKDLQIVSLHKTNGKAKKLSYRARQFQGLRTGDLVHTQLHRYARVMDFAHKGLKDKKKQRYKAFERLCEDEVSNGEPHICTLEIIDACKAWGWVILDAEWCVGDIHGQLKHGTAIDLIAVPRDPNQKQRIKLCEVKTGFNNHGFFRNPGFFENFPKDYPMADSPLNQAKMQLVFGAIMFQKTYNLRWDELELWVIHCPTEIVVGHNLEVGHYKVSKEERRLFESVLTAYQLVN